MEQWNFKCRKCGTTMHQKARGGARQFESVSFAVQAVQSSILGNIEDDPGRPASTLDSIWGKDTEEGAPDHNFTMLFNNWGQSGRFPKNVRTEAAKDLVIRVSMREDKPQKDEAMRALDWFLGIWDRLETDEERAALKCYMTGGHDYEHTETTEN